MEDLAHTILQVAGACVFIATVSLLAGWLANDDDRTAPAPDGAEPDPRWVTVAIYREYESRSDVSRN